MQNTSFKLFLTTYHKHRLVAFVDRMVIDHANNSNTQVASNTKGDAEAQTAQDGNDVPPVEAEAGAVHHGQLLLLHQLRAAFSR